jgi:hypothetical protein
VARDGNAATWQAVGHEMIAEMRSLARWYWLWVKAGARRIWDDLPGPWYVKILLIVITQVVIPGPLDDAVILLGPRIARKVIARYRARRTRALAA